MCNKSDHTISVCYAKSWSLKSSVIGKDRMT